MKTFDQWYSEMGGSEDGRIVKAALHAAYEAGTQAAYDLQHAAFTAPDLSFAELRAKNVQRCEESFYPLIALSPIEWAARIEEELGEFFAVLNKMHRAQLNPKHPTVLTLQDAADELGDVQTCVDLVAARLGIDLSQATRRKFNIVSDRVGSKVRL